MPTRLELARVLDAFEKLHGAPKPPPTADPLELIFWENVAYLADDERREAAFHALKKRVGTRGRAGPQRSRGGAPRDRARRDPGRGPGAQSVPS